MSNQKEIDLKVELEMLIDRQIHKADLSDNEISILEKCLNYIERTEKAKKEIERLQLTARQANPSDERDIGYKLGTLNACNIALKALGEVKE